MQPLTTSNPILIDLFKRMYLMYHVTDAKGERKASYDNLSEALTYFKASSGVDGPKFDPGVQKDEIRVFTTNDDEVGSILLPRDWKPTDDEQKELKRYGIESK